MIKKIIAYVLSILNPFGTDSGKDFCIKSILGLILAIIISDFLSYIVLTLLYYMGNGKFLLGKFIVINLLIIFLVFGYIQISLVIRRYRYLGDSPWKVIFYLIVSLTGIFGIIYWIYLCLRKKEQ